MLCVGYYIHIDSLVYNSVLHMCSNQSVFIKRYSMDPQDVDVWAAVVFPEYHPSVTKQYLLSAGSRLRPKPQIDQGARQGFFLDWD